MSLVSLDELRQYEIFKDLTEAELENIKEIAKREVYNPGIRIFEEKSLATNLYVVSEGEVEIGMRSEKSTEPIPIDTVSSGEIFGWSAVTEPFTFTAAAKTLRKSKLLVFDGKQLLDLFKKNNHIGYKMMRKISSVISARLRQLRKRFVEFSPQEKKKNYA